MGSVTCSGEEALRSFIGRTRKINECLICVEFLRDPVEIKCGHIFCRNCITHQLAGNPSVQCPQCRIPFDQQNLKKSSAKVNKLTSSVRKFVQDFCNEGGWKLDYFMTNTPSSLPSSRTLPLSPLKENDRITVKQTEVDEATNPSFSCFSKIPRQNTLEPQTKVQQWLMTNPGLSASSVGQEDCENAPTVRDSEASSKRMSFSITTSSTGKESSYDIVNAPSPPPPRDELQQNKRGRGGRRGRTRTKNALPISSGETLARKRGRSAGSTTPDDKQPVVNTPIRQSISPLVPETTQLEISKSKTPNTMACTPKTNVSNTLVGGNCIMDPRQDSFCESFSIEENGQTVQGDTSHMATKQSMEKSAVCSVPPTIMVQSMKSVSSDRTIPLIEPTLYESTGKKSPNLLSSAATSSPQVENQIATSSSTSHHLTPLSRPSRVRNSLGAFGKTLQSLAPDVRRHSSAEGSGKRLVNFFHVGRIVPRKSTSPIMKHPIAFTRLGKLGPKLEVKTSCIPISNENLKSETLVAVKDTQTTSLVQVSVGTQTDAVEAIETCVQATQTTPVEILDVNKPLELSNEQVQREEREMIVAVNELDECSEDAFMFAEPFKRARVLSSSEEENEKMDNKRRKNSDSVDPLDFEPPTLPSSAEIKTQIPESIPEKPPQLEPDSDAACKTVVMESDPESDGGDILAATPPPPPAVKIITQRQVFTCSGLPRSQVKIVEEWAKRIGAEVSLTYTPAVTHIIVQLDEENCAQRTLKFLFGVANGKWIVGVDWVHQSIREARIIDEEPFEALDMDGESGPRRARQISRTNKLFEAFEFCCQDPFTDVTVDQLRQLLELCGAATVSNPVELTKSRRHAMIIIQTDDTVGLEVQRKAVNWFERLQILSVSREWVLDCLAAYQLLPVRNQLIGKHSESLLRMMGFDSQLLA